MSITTKTMFLVLKGMCNHIVNAKKKKIYSYKKSIESSDKKMKWLSSVSGTIVTLESIISLYMRLLLVNARVKLVSGAEIDRFRIKKKYVSKEKR